jgi:hypothetical protein
LLQTLAEVANVAIRKAGIPIEDIRRTVDAWRAVSPLQAADDGDIDITFSREGRTGNRIIGCEGSKVPSAASAPNLRCDCGDFCGDNGDSDSVGSSAVR